METAIQILGIASLILCIINHDLWIKMDWKRKPLSCALCMGWWLSLVPSFLIWDWWGIPYAALIAIIVELVDRKINMI